MNSSPVEMPHRVADRNQRRSTTFFIVISSAGSGQQIDKALDSIDQHNSPQMFVGELNQLQ
jgi:hypothetical protein